MMEESDFAEATGDTGQRPSTFASRPLIIVVVSALFVVGLALMLLRSQPRVARASTPVTVNGERVGIAQNATTWTYLEFATAGLGDPIAPEPVPARVAFDEMRSTPMVAPLPGRVDAVTARLGQRVEQGERLLSVRSAALVDLAKEISLMTAEEAARAKAVDRLRSLAELKAVPEKDLIAAEQDLHQTQLARGAAELKLRSLPVATTNDSIYWLTAPRSGVVVQRDVLVGQEVGPERDAPLLVVGDLDEVIVTADVPETDIAGVEVGQSARVLSALASDQGFSGRVEYIGEVVDPHRRMVEVRVRVPNPEHVLRANAFVQVVFAPGSARRIVVPAEAVVTDDQESFIFVRRADLPTELERRRVVLGRQQGGHVEISNGLNAGETYVTKGAILLLNAVDLASQ